jgi:hypothetical protein
MLRQIITWNIGKMQTVYTFRAFANQFANINLELTLKLRVTSNLANLVKTEELL